MYICWLIGIFSSHDLWPSELCTVYMEPFVVRSKKRKCWECGGVMGNCGLVKQRERCAGVSVSVLTECCWEMFTTAETHPINNIAAERTDTMDACS